MYKDFMKSLLEIDRFLAREIIIKEKSNSNLIEDIIVPALKEIGEGWEEGIYSLSQVYMSSVICEDLAEELFTDMEKIENQKLNLAIVTFEDYHTFGKRIVTLTLKSAGYHVQDYGMIFDENELLRKVKEDKIDILFMSVLMLPPALKIKQLKPKLLEINKNIKVIVGGAPFRFDDQLFEEVGADYYGKTSSDALTILKELEGRL